MEKEKKSVDSLLAEGDLMSLVELQKFLAEELATPETGSDFSRSFTPLTDGLGLESPKRPEAPAVIAPAAKPAPGPTEPPSRPVSPETRRRMAVDELFRTDPLTPKAEFQPPKAVPPPREAEEDEEITPTERVATRALVQPTPAPLLTARPVRPEPEPTPQAAPPPMPVATFSRRLMAGLLDQIFILTLWATALAITGGILKGSGPEASAALVKEFTNPQFVRFAAMEFAVFWLVYLALGIGILDMTFGMWVWNLRLCYPGAKGDRAFLRKLLRVVFGFFFYAPVLPTVLLVLRVKGRNLLDFLSGTALYRTMS